MTAPARPFFGGVPTAPDVEKLLEHFGVPQPGVITYSDLSEVLGMRWRTARFRSVVDAWRHRLRREHNISTRAELGEGIRILAEHERADVARDQLRRGARSSAKAVREVRDTRIEQLDEKQRAHHDHVAMVAERIFHATTEAVRQITPPRAPRQLP